MGLEDTKDLVSGDEADLGDTMGVTEGNTDLGGRETLAGKFDDLLDDFLRRGFEPRWGSPAVWQGRGRLWSVRVCEALARENVQMPFPGACMRPMATTTRTGD